MCVFCLFVVVVVFCLFVVVVVFSSVLFGFVCVVVIVVQNFDLIWVIMFASQMKFRKILSRRRLAPDPKIARSGSACHADHNELQVLAARNAKREHHHSHGDVKHSEGQEEHVAGRGKHSEGQEGHVAGRGKHGDSRLVQGDTNLDWPGSAWTSKITSTDVARTLTPASGVGHARGVTPTSASRRVTSARHDRLGTGKLMPGAVRQATPLNHVSHLNATRNPDESLA